MQLSRARARNSDVHERTSFLMSQVDGQSDLLVMVDVLDAAARIVVRVVRARRLTRRRRVAAVV